VSWAYKAWWEDDENFEDIADEWLDVPVGPPTEDEATLSKGRRWTK
jgi:hypothetical protein